MLQLRLLGGLSVRNDRVLSGAGSQKKSLALLAVVAAARNGGISREKLLGYFWPDAPEERGKNALRQRLFALRRDLGVDELFVGGNELGLNRAVVDADLWRFEAAETAGDFERAASEYAGPLLDGVYLSDLPELERWIEERRQELASRAAQAFVHAAARHHAAARFDSAVMTWRRLLALDHTNVAGTVGLMTTLASAGDPAAALQHFRVYGALLREQYDVEPDARVVMLAEDIRDGRVERSETPVVVPVLDGSRERIDDVAAELDDTFARDMSRATPVLFERLAGRSWRRVTMLATAAGGVALFAWLMVGGRSDRSSSENDLGRVRVAEFRNESGDSALTLAGQQLATSMSLALARSGAAPVIDPRTTASSDARIGRDDAAAQVLVGTFHRTGDSIVARAALTDAHTGIVRTVIAPVAAPRDSIAQLWEQLQSRVIGALRATRDPIFLTATGTLTDLPNAPAYREYMLGLELASQGDWSLASQYFLRAFEFDSSFHHAALWALEAAGDADRQRLLAYLDRRRDQLSNLDRSRLDYHVTWRKRELARAYVHAREMVTLAPGSWMALQAFAKVAMETRRFDEAAAALRNVDISQPLIANFAGFYVIAANVMLLAGDYMGALRLGQYPASVGVKNYGACQLHLRALVALGRTDRLDREIDACAAIGTEDAESNRVWVNDVVAQELYWRGNRTLAMRHFETMLEIDKGRVARGRYGEEILGDTYLQLGRYAEAHRLLRMQFDKGSMRPIQVANAAIAAVKVGDSAAVAVYRAHLERVPNSRVRLLTLARVAAAEGRYERALQLLEEFESAGGLVVQQLYGDRAFEAMWDWPEYRRFFLPR